MRWTSLPHTPSARLSASGQATIAAESRSGLVASHHLPLPFPQTLCLRRRRCPSASQHLVPSLSLPGVSLPPYSPSPVRGCVVCWSQRASTRQHKKSLVSGTIATVRLDTPPPYGDV